MCSLSVRKRLEVCLACYTAAITFDTVLLASGVLLGLCTMEGCKVAVSCTSVLTALMNDPCALRNFTDSRIDSTSVILSNV